MSNRCPIISFFSIDFTSEIWCLVWKIIFNGLSGLIWDRVDLQLSCNYGEGCKCLISQKRWPHLFSNICCIWSTQFHRNIFALWTAIFWWKLLIKTSNAFTFWHLLKILIFENGVAFRCARNCHILWGAGPLLSGGLSMHRGEQYWCFSMCFPDMPQWSENRLLFLKSDIEKNSANKKRHSF